MLKRILKFFKISINPKVEELPNLKIEELNNKITELTISKNELKSQPLLLKKEDNLIESLSGQSYKDASIENLEDELVNKYFNDSDSLIEKKYKLVILSLAFEQKGIFLSKNPIIDGIIKKIAQELIDNGETSINLHEIFNKDIEYRYMELMMAIRFPELRKVIGTELIPKILNEDSENINIVKKIYNQFSSLGFLANTFIDAKPNIDIFMQLQDHKFTNEDMAILKNFANKISDPNYDGYHAIKLSIPHWEKLMLNENNIDNLNIFKQLFLHSDGKMNWYSYSYLIIDSQNNREESKNHLVELVEKRISYFEVSNYLDLQPQEEKQKRKQPKL